MIDTAQIKADVRIAALNSHSLPSPRMQEPRNRIARIRELFGECSHQEQLHLLYDLVDYLKKDFFKLLPPELVEHVLSYLPPTCVMGSCIRVSVVFYLHSILCR